jgi:hypothetical protein
VSQDFDRDSKRGRWSQNVEEDKIGFDEGDVYVSQQVDTGPRLGPIGDENSTRWQRFKDSFKPADFSGDEYANLDQVERAALATARSPLARNLRSRHLQMIAIGGAIGTGLFIGSGGSLATGGPASLLKLLLC